MTDLARLRRVDTLFARALERPPDERTAFLRHHCGDDLELYRTVEELLALEAEAASVLGESVTDFAAPLLPGLEQELAGTADDLPAGSRVGPYRLVREIGRGGMGAVYLAERADGQFEQRVALKVVKRGMDTDEILRRFRYERQILASLQHPHVARLYDGGVTGDGRPFLAMEYVEGEPLTDYCDARRFDVEERLALFETVGRAVQYAHQNLVVHRDLKPANILVTSEGHIKLLDFGIARLLAPDAGWTAPHTRTGLRLLTPAYAAPEQLRGEPVTTASDVYALGVILYELLTGRRPFDGDASLQRVAASEHAHEPERPSTAVMHPRDDGRTPEALAARRGTSADRLRRRLRGDLDTMLLKALRHEPTRRYATAEALADDVRRHRSGQPIAARPATVGYRTRKFTRRHRLPLAATAVAALLLIAFAAFYTLRITQERDRAQHEAARAQAALSFVEDLFEGADPDETQGDTLTVFDLLARGARQVAPELERQPDVQTVVQRTLGTLYLKLGDYPQADTLLRQALATQQRIEAPAPTDVAATLLAIAHLRTSTGDIDAADSLFQRAAELRAAALGPRHAQVAEAYGEWGAALASARRLRPADSLLNHALSLFRQSTGTHAEATSAATFALASIRMNEARYAEAESLYLGVLTDRRARLGDVHSATADVLNDLGNLYVDQRDYDRAEPLLREALAIQRQLFGTDHPNVSLALSNLALVPYGRGDYDGALALMQESLAIIERRVGREHHNAAMTLNNIGWVWAQKGDLPRAETTFRETLGIMQRTSGPVSSDAALLLGNVGWALHQQQRYAEAEPFFRQALEVREAVHGPESMHVAWRLYALAENLRAQQRYAEAEALHRRSVALRRGLREEGHYDIARGLAGLGGVLVDQARYDEAEPVLLESYEAFAAAVGPEHAQTQQARAALVALYEAWGRPDEADRFRGLAGGTE